MVLAGYTNKVIKNVKEAEEYVIRIYLWTIQPQFHHVISLWKSSCPSFTLYGAHASKLLK